METIDVRILKAGDGKYLTNGEIICEVIQLAPSSNELDWWEIDEGEKERIEKEQEEKEQQIDEQID